MARTRSVVGWPAILAGLALAGSPALADHLSLYDDTPVEHDDLGRSDEPDNLATGIFGPPLTNAVADLDLDHFADVPTPAQQPGKNRRIAPGCTDVEGTRLASGQCGLHSTGLIDEFPLIVQEGNCPGRFGADPVVLFDLRSDAAVWTAIGHPQLVDLNHKLTDTDATSGGLLGGLGAGPLLFGPTVLWAWYGLWQDKNCNGVIDHRQHNQGAGVALPANEFVWFGACHDLEGDYASAPIAGGYCAEDLNMNADPPGESQAARTNMTAYVWPGSFPSGSSPLLPAGLPSITSVLTDHPVPKFDDQPYLLAPDLYGLDSSGAGQTKDRLWVFASEDAGDLEQHNGQPSWFYDQSILVTTTLVAGVNCRPNDQAAGFDLGASGSPGSACAFVDVDRVTSYTPLLEPLMQGLKSTTFDVWNAVADIVNGVYNDQGPVSRLLSQILGRTFYDSTLGPQRGLLQELLVDPGWAREPNVGPTLLATGEVVEDVYVDVRHASDCEGNPGLTATEKAFRGWCNYAPSDPTGFQAYKAYQGRDFRGWVDLKPGKVLAWVPGLAGDATFVDFPLTDWVNLPPGDAPLSPDEHTRTLDAGQWYFEGWMGRWRDAVNIEDESVWPQPSAQAPCSEDPSQSSCESYDKDGWIGFLSGGEQVYQGYAPESCTTEEGPGLHQFAQCHPYSDGNDYEPQAYGDATEWQGACKVQQGDKVLVYPLDGIWSIPVLVVNDFRQTGPPDITPLLPGDTDTITLRVDDVCRDAGDDDPVNHRSWTKDHLILPQGSAGETLVTVHRGAVEVTIGGNEAEEPITDVDVYGSALVPP